MNRQDKTAAVDDLQQKLEGASAFYVTDFTGLNVKQITQFRARLRKQGVEYVVVKNTLAKRALTALELNEVAEFFTGPTGLVIGSRDPVAAAKALTDFAREFDNRPSRPGSWSARPYRPMRSSGSPSCRRGRYCSHRSRAGCRRRWRAWQAE